MPTTPSALAIANDLLTRTGDAMQTGDFAGFMQCFSVPLVMETFDGKQLLQTRSDIERVFDAVRTFRSSNAIVEVIRENVAAEFVAADTIAATHVCRMLQEGNVLFGRPYPAYSTIRKVDGIWRINFCQYALDDLLPLNQALRSSESKTPRNSAAPLVR